MEKHEQMKIGIYFSPVLKCSKKNTEEKMHGNG